MSSSTAGLVRALVDRGAADEAEALAHQALLDSTGTERAELLLAQSVVQVSRGQYVPALAATVEAGELFQAAGQTARVCDALLGTAGTLRAAGDHDTALATLEHAETLARSAGDELQTGRVLRQIGIVSSIVGRHQHALSCLEEACAILARHAGADEQRNARLSLLNARNRRIDGQPDSPALRAQAEGMLQDWVDLAQAMSDAGQARMAVMAWGNHAITLHPAGRHREAADALRALIPRYQAYGMRPNEGLAHTEL
ncbi:MAG: tetratricopeptide repeat protein, partial [Rubrivivax sp.]|nr:tetratricopeptide repeat protein [Rubrivivax sp.]